MFVHNYIYIIFYFLLISPIRFVWNLLYNSIDDSISPLDHASILTEALCLLALCQSKDSRLYIIIMWAHMVRLVLLVRGLELESIVGAYIYLCW